MSWRGPLAVVFFFATEALLWSVGLRWFATAVERAAFRDVADVIALGIPDGEFLQPDRARDALVLAEQAGEGVIGGPPLLLIIAVAAGAFLLTRLLGRTELPDSSRAAIGMLVSIAAIGLALQLSFAEGAPWEGGIVADLRGDGADSYVGEIDAVAFIDDPDADRVRGASRTVTTAGIVLIWLRFLLAGRGQVTFERSLRSFGIGFGVIVVAALLAGASDADVGGWLVLPYFVLGALSLATAHAARAPDDETAVRREAPWVISVLGTLAFLTALTAIFVTLTLLDAQRAIEPIAKALLAIVAWTLIIVLTPIVWVLALLIEPFIGDGQLPSIGFEIEQVTDSLDEDREDNAGANFPGWMISALRGGLILGAIWIVYRVGKKIFERSRGRSEEEYVEVRAAEGGGGGLGALLRALIPRPRRRRRADWGWLARSRAYRLFGRMLSAAHLRGLDREPGETALEFGEAAGERLDAAPFAEIAGAFDSARYGRHDPPPQRLDALERAFDEWERTHPPTNAEADPVLSEQPEDPAQDP